MSNTIRLTAAQAMVKWLSVQMTEAPSSSSEAVGQTKTERFVDGIWGIFGHGNVAGLGEALYEAGDDFPTWRGQNEQTMAHAAIAYAKQLRRRRAMAVTSSIGPGALNMVTRPGPWMVWVPVGSSSKTTILRQSEWTCF